MSTEDRWDKGLTGKQRAWCIWYVRTLNATRAAQEAKYSGSYDTLKSIGHENLTKPHLLRAIDLLYAQADMSAAEIGARLAAQARGEAPTRVIQQGRGVRKVYDSNKALNNLAEVKGLKDEKRGTGGVVGILVLPAPRPPGELSARQKTVDLEIQPDGSYGPVSPHENGKNGTKPRGVISRRPTKSEEQDDER